MSIFAILLSLALLMYFAYRGVSVLILAPVLAILAVVLSGQGTQSMGIYTQIFMDGMGGFAIKYFPLFILGAIFGKLMEDSGYAYSIARYIVNKLGDKHALLAVVLACAILTYGGVSVFVVTFAVYPIAAELFKQVNIPKRFIPGAISIGAFTFTMTALPGSPAIHNAIPMPYFQTDAFAAPILGLIAAVMMLVGGMWWMQHQLRVAAKNNEGYGTHTLNEKELDIGDKIPNFWLALFPVVIVVVGNYLFSKLIIPMWNNSYLTDEKFGGVSLSSVVGLWSIILSLAIACLFVIVLNFTRIKNLAESLNKGAMGSLLPIFNTASEVGYGSVIAGLAGFSIIQHFLMGISPNNPLISEAIIINVLAGITGSASGGLGIALEVMGANYMQLAQQYNIDPELMHRIAALASGGLDALPHNGAVITMLTICGLTHRESYKDVFVTAVIVPIIALIVIIFLGTIFGSF
ncbi:GntP family permease [Psychrobacter sanguinis]|uniref:GntP family permease n=1 Tax=Psychrobacter sanguinis TaxID=861445 RepID=UPI00020C93F0|nr:GntP family permease [Psychrobacter sanguinis]EGK14069.1 UIT2 family protein [Psychrobacter sp. 1501(2011)]MCC3308706.1 GntP family permease [Psychrobacter sanguinis]MCD9150593.1 GntP family permease [Psychrobacter sanguinis]